MCGAWSDKTIKYEKNQSLSEQTWGDKIKTFDFKHFFKNLGIILDLNKEWWWTICNPTHISHPQSQIINDPQITTKAPIKDRIKC